MRNFEQLLAGVKKTNKKISTQGHMQFKFNSHRQGQRKELLIQRVQAG